jgi:hypothetical protein
MCPASELNQWIDGWLAANTTELTAALAVDDYVIRTYACLLCGSTIEWIAAYMSIHDGRWSECVGGGEVQIVTIPHCPQCEPHPNTQGCLHVGRRFDQVIRENTIHEGFAVRTIKKLWRVLSL